MRYTNRTRDLNPQHGTSFRTQTAEDSPTHTWAEDVNRSFTEYFHINPGEAAQLEDTAHKTHQKAKDKDGDSRCQEGWETAFHTSARGQEVIQALWKQAASFLKGQIIDACSIPYRRSRWQPPRRRRAHVHTKTCTRTRTLYTAFCHKAHARQHLPRSSVPCGHAKDTPSTVQP